MKKRSFLLVSLMLFTMLQQALAMQNLVKAPTGSNIQIKVKSTDIIEDVGAETQEENTQNKTTETSDNITYNILSEDDKTAYVSRFYFETNDIPAEGLSIEIPETVEINGETYTVVQFGTKNFDDVDNFEYYKNNAPLSITFPQTLKSLGGHSLYKFENTTFIFKNENAPLPLSDDTYMSKIYCRGNVYVPYGAEEAYEAKFTPYAQIQSRHTDLTITEGSIEVNGSKYTQHKADGDVTGTIDETLVIYSDDATAETENSVVISGGTEEQPVRVALKDVNINRANTVGTAVMLSDGAYVDMILQGTNTLRGGNSAAGLRVAASNNEPISTLNICQLSTGTLNTYGGSTSSDGWGGGAGIGGNVYENPGYIIINAGTIYAEGCKGGAGIGGGWKDYFDYGTRPQGKITINGGDITAKGSKGEHDENCPEGIGSLYGNVDVVITGGNLNATIRNGSTIKDEKGNVIVRKGFNGLTPDQEITVSQISAFGNTVTVGKNGSIYVYVLETATNDEIFCGKKLIRAYVNDTNRGCITGGGVYSKDEEVKLTVTLQKNKSVTGWSDDGSNTSPERTITVSEDAQYTAYLADSRDPICYDVLSEEEGTAYVSRLYYETVPEEGLDITFPETVEIDGNTYKLVQFGNEGTYGYDDFGLRVDRNVSITIPETMKTIWSLPLHGIVWESTLVFKSEIAPTFLPEPRYIEARRVYVPYGAEEAYSYIRGNITSHHTDLNIVEGAIEVNGGEYTQHKADGDVTDTIDETLVIYSDDATVETVNDVMIGGGTEEQPVRVALKDVNINRGNTVGEAVMLSDGAYVDMIIQGTNTLHGGNSAAGLRVATRYKEDGTPEISTLNICQLSTGTLNTYGGSASSDGWGGGAGIGGNVYENPGNIFINAGTINAEGCKGSAGIGSGWICSKSTYTRCSRIAIYGGNVKAVYGGDGRYDHTCGISVGEAVGSANNSLLFYVSENATFEGTKKSNVITTDADGNFSATATIYRGNENGSEETISLTSTLEDNAIAFTDVPGLTDYVNNVVLRQEIHDEIDDGVSYESNTCRNLNLVEGKPFYTPENFKAENACFTVNTDENFVYADGTNGWHTLCLPFSGNFYADDEPITPFKSNEDTNGTFWLKTFSGEVDSDVLGFDYATSVEAGKPYIYTIPGDKWGKEHSMTGKQISVRATNTSVSMTLNNATGTAYSFEGSLTNSSIDNSYVLNADGNAFELQQSSIEIQPFSAVIKATAAQSGAPKKSLYITGGSATGIYNVTPETEVKSSSLYNLKGQRVSKPAKGTIYIKGGKKYIY